MIGVRYEITVEAFDAENARRALQFIADTPDCLESGRRGNGGPPWAGEPWKWSIERSGELPKALRGIAPEVGSIWEWMPLTEARETLVVTDVAWNGEACFVTSRRFGDLSANPKTFPNELDRWVEATVHLREADAPVIEHFVANPS